MRLSALAPLLLLASCRAETGPIPPERAKDVRYLLRRLRDPDAHVRARAIDLLGAAGDLRAVDALIDALSDGAALDGSDNFVGGHAGSALYRLTKERFGMDQVEWRRWWTERRRDFGE